MDVDLAQELLNEMGSSLQNLETQHAALLQFLKDDGIVTDERLAPYLTQAGHASSVRWRAARIRLERLISTEKQVEEQHPDKEPQAKEAAVRNDGGSGETTPQGEVAAANAPTESAGAQSKSGMENRQDERATSEDKEPSEKQENNAA